MFGLPRWPFVPDFWISPQKSTPGFNVKEPGLHLEQNDVSSSAATAMEVPGSRSIPPQEHEFMIQAAPFFELPEFQLYPQFDIARFNINEYGFPSFSTAPTVMGQTGTIAIPEDGLATQSAPSSLSPGFRVKPQDVVPGFNVRPHNYLAGFNPGESSTEPGEPIWSPMPADLPPGKEWPDKPEPVWPERPDDEVLALPQQQIVIDPIAGPRLPANTLPAAPPYIAPWVSNAPWQSSDPAIRAHVVAGQYSSPSSAQEATSPPSSPARDVGSNAHGTGDLPAMPPVRLPSTANAIGPNHMRDDSAYVRQLTPLNPYLVRQRILQSAEPTKDALPEASSTTTLQRRSSPEIAKASAPYRGSEEVEVKQAIAAGPSAQPTQDRKAESIEVNNAEPSLAQRLAVSTVDALVPGAHYQSLARQQFEAKNYVGAAVYQTAALADAVLGVATFGLSTRAAAASRAAAAKGRDLFLCSFDSWEQFKNYLKLAPPNMQWHHIVEQNKAAQFGQRAVQRVDNIVAIPTEAHRELNRIYSSKEYYSEPKVVREWLKTKTFEEQYEFGMEQLKQVLGY